MSVSTKHRPLARSSQVPAPQAATAAAAPAEVAPRAPVPVYRGDTYGLMIWFGGAMILTLLHILDAVYWWIHS